MGWAESGFWVMNSVDSLNGDIFYIQWLCADFSSLPHSAFNLVWAIAISSSLMTSGCWIKIMFPNASTILHYKLWRVCWMNWFIQRLSQPLLSQCFPSHHSFCSLRYTHGCVFSFSALPSFALQKLRPGGVLQRLHWWTLCLTNILPEESLMSSLRRVSLRLWRLSM